MVNARYEFATMKYLLNGDDTVASRNFLNELTNGFALTLLDGKSLTLKDLEQNLLSTSLFEEKKAIVIENLFSKNTKKKDFITFLNSQPDLNLVIFWEDRKILKTSTKGLKDTIIRDFLLPQNYFEFLDSVIPGQQKRIFLLYHNLLKSMTVEIVFYSLLKRVRLLTILASGGSVDELSKMSPWQLSKLKQQGKGWSIAQLLFFYNKLQEAEIKLKSGKLPTTLSKHLDILILSDLI